MAELRGVKVLQNEIEKSRDRLKNFNENIKKLTGYENPGPRARRILSGENPDYDGRLGRGRGRLFGIAKRGLLEDGGPSTKRRAVGGAFSRLGPPPASARRRDREDSPYEDDTPNKLSLQSSVVATSREAKNREDIMQEQTKDKEGMQRNRRMFGLLLGTLNKFKTESKTLESKEEQRKRIDKKLEENAEKEKKKFKQETKQLIEEMHLEETRISRLQQKMDVVQEHGDWEREVKRLKNFICTKTKPRIFWLPRQMNSMLENKLKESNRVVDGILKDGQARLEKEIQDVMERENKREERIKMRLKEDGLFQEEEEKNEGGKKEDRKRGESSVQSRGQRETSSLRHEDSSDQGQLESKSKQKRRVVIEKDSDADSRSEDDETDQNEQFESKKSDRGGRKIEVEFSKRQEEEGEDNDSDKGDDNQSDSSRDDSDRDQKVSRAKKLSGRKEDQSDRISGSSKSRGKERSKSREEGLDKGPEISARVVMHRSSSGDRDWARKGRHRRDTDENGKDRDTPKGSQDSKHSSQPSRHSQKDNARVVVKQEKDEVEGRKKKILSGKDDDESDSDDDDDRETEGASSKRNPSGLMGEEDDVEMESEPNTTL